LKIKKEQEKRDLPSNGSTFDLPFCMFLLHRIAIL
jgi:hypothetical protein